MNVLDFKQKAGITVYDVERSAFKYAFISSDTHTGEFSFILGIILCNVTVLSERVRVFLAVWLMIK